MKALFLKDIVSFSAFCGMYATGGHTAFGDADGNHVIYGSGDVPRTYTLDGQPIAWEDLKRKTRGVKFAKFHAGAVQ